MRGRLFVAMWLAASVLFAATHVGAESIPPNAMIDIAYGEPRNPAFLPYYVALQQRKVLEELRAFLSPLKLPRRISIRVDQCDAPYRLYEPGQPVLICYEYVDRLNQLAAAIPADRSGPLGVSRQDAVVGAFVQAALQQTASAVFDALETPIWGREQDAADKLAAFLMMQFGSEAARKLLTGAAYFFEASNRSWSGVDFSDERAPEAQRYFNYLCIAYGFDPRLFGDFNGGSRAPGAHGRSGALPMGRAVRCPKEYADVKWAFDTQILPHVDPDRLDAVLHHDWLKPYTD